MLLLIHYSTVSVVAEGDFRAGVTLSLAKLSSCPSGQAFPDRPRALAWVAVAQPRIAARIVGLPKTESASGQTRAVRLRG